MYEFRPAHGCLFLQAVCSIGKRTDKYDLKKKEEGEGQGTFHGSRSQEIHEGIRSVQFRDRPDCSLQYSILSNLVS